MSTAPTLVVGAGPSGLGCALALAEQGPVEVFDRIPVPGGEQGWTSQPVKDLVRQVVRAGVRLTLGVSACAWENHKLLVAAPGDIRWKPGSHLFFAGGLRPATAADTGVTGDRPAGVLPATVASHLLEAGVPLWRRPVLVGSGPWVEHIDARVTASGGTTTKVAATFGPRGTADTRWGGIEVIGRTRVTAVRVPSEHGHREIPCDAVILGADPRPVRNVEGALADDSTGVTFVQPVTGHSVRERSEAARDITLRWLNENLRKGRSA